MMKLEEFVAHEGDVDWRLVPRWNLKENEKNTSIQSIVFTDGILSVLYDGSIIQTYRDGSLEREFQPQGESIFHANDVTLLDDDFLVVDTIGTRKLSPVLRLYDPSSHTVKASWNLHTQGYRIAAISSGFGDCIYCVLVEDIDPVKRTAMVVSICDLDNESLTEIVRIPLRHAYVQGCTIKGNELFITANDGATSETTRFLSYNVSLGKITHDILFNGFGESEGLFCCSDGTILTGRNLRKGKSAVYELVELGYKA